MPDTSARLGLPYLVPAQAQKHVTVNEGLLVLDTLVQLSLAGVEATTPPASPAEGETWALGAGATDAWAGQDGKLARWDGGAWLFIAPVAGWLASTPAGGARVYDGALWRNLAAHLQNVEGVGVNAASDGVNRLAVASEATLLTHDGAGHQLKINKAATADTATLLYQTGWSGRAEMGLAGDDNWSLKVSPDGAAWAEALRVHRASAKVTLGSALRLTPGPAPAAPVAGDLYFDDVTVKLRCYDGTLWHDLF